jgi:hypothetical protein
MKGLYLSADRLYALASTHFELWYDYDALSEGYAVYQGIECFTTVPSRDAARAAIVERLKAMLKGEVNDAQPR